MLVGRRERVRVGRRRRACRRGDSSLPAASLLLNLTINSYKRLVPGWFAPINVSWGLENRSCALRVIRGDDPTRSRIECRRPGADANPCLALAVLVASAADGIRRGAEPPEPVEGDAYARDDLPAPRLPRERARRVPGRRELRAALGEEFSDYYVTSREWELSAWREGVSDWERVGMSEPSDLPLIGICAVRERAKWSFWEKTVHLVADSYVGIVQRAGGLALILPVDTRSPVPLSTPSTGSSSSAAPTSIPPTAPSESPTRGHLSRADAFEIAPS